MMHILIPVIVLASTAQAISYSPIKYSAASAAQIKFAIENKYDDTGPGAKEPEYAYHTYKNLDDALVAYLDDPNTKLPEHEKARAIANLYRNNQYNYVDDDIPKREEPFTDSRAKVGPIVHSKYSKYELDPRANVFDLDNDAWRKEPFKWQKEQAVKASRLSISHYNKDNQQFDFKPDPQLSFSYDTNNKEDQKSTQEQRDGNGAVHGYYTLVEADGGRRTVHYQADPTRGFRSSVQRVYHN